MLSPALASEDVERRARSLFNRSRPTTRLPPAARPPPAAATPPAAAGRASTAPPSRADVLELRGWRRGWAMLREAQAHQLEISRDRLDAMEPGLSSALLELGQLLPGVGGLTLFIPTTADDDRGGGRGGGGGGGGSGVGGGGGERSAAPVAFTSQARMEAPYLAALRWQLGAGLERPHAEACALLNASEACGVPRDARLADFCHADGGSTSLLESRGW